MSEARTYAWLQLRGSGRDVAALRNGLLESVFPAWRRAEISVWGVWSGLFGVASNELLVVAAAAGVRNLQVFAAALGGIELRDSLLLEPTVRPEGDAPCTREGLYVFRFFDTLARDVDEIVRLSNEAWTTFERTSDYRAEPQGLFRPLDEDTGVARDGRMLLVTWYDGLESWQRSRRPAPEATRNFARRRELTTGTVALATQLVTDWAR